MGLQGKKLDVLTLTGTREVLLFMPVVAEDCAVQPARLAASQGQNEETSETSGDHFWADGSHGRN